MLPTGRTVFGGFLVAAAAVIVFAVAISDASRHGQPVVVAARALPAGTVIGPGDTDTESITLPSGARAVSFRQAAVVVGRTLAVAAAPGELIQASMLEPPNGVTFRPVSVPVDPDSLAALASGTTVDVLATPSTSTGPVTVVLRGAKLLAVSRGGSSLLPGSTSPAVATLGVTDLPEAEAVVQAAHTGTITLVQAEPTDGAGPGG